MNLTTTTKRLVVLLPLLLLIQATTTCNAFLSNAHSRPIAQLRSTKTLPSPRFVLVAGIPPKSHHRDVTRRRRRQRAPFSHTGESDNITTNNKSGSIGKPLRHVFRTRRLVRWLGCMTLFAVATTLLSPSLALASTTPALAAESSALSAATVALVEPTAITTSAAALLSPVPPGVELTLCLRLLFASLLGACVGKERSSTHKHSAGVRTMALVALGACAFTICSSIGFSHLGASKCDPSRMASNVASGVGFVGAGVITTSANGSDSRQSIVHGLTTATAIWISAAIGVSCDVGLLYIATFTTISTVTILRFGRLNKKFEQAQEWWDHKFQPSKLEAQHRPLERLVEPAATASTNNEVVMPTMATATATTGSTTATVVESTSARREEPPSSLEEMNQEDDWDSHVESVELYDDDEDQDDDNDDDEEEAERRPAEETIPVSAAQPKQDYAMEDPDVAEFHQVGQSSILEGAHTASFGNQTELVARYKAAGTSQRQQNRTSFEDESIRPIMEPAGRSGYRGSRSRGGDSDVLGP